MGLNSYVDVVAPAVSSNLVAGQAQVTTVVVGGTTPTTTTAVSQSAVNVVQPGGTVANVQWGYDFPPAPAEGQIFIKVTP